MFIERNAGVPEKDRSFLMLQENEASCCVLIHGAGGSPDEMRVIAGDLFSRGYSVYSIHLSLDPKSVDSGLREFFTNRFSGRKPRISDGKNGNTGSSWSVCLSESRVALETVLSYTRSAYLVGLSLGGTIALNLMNKYPVKGTVLIAPALFPVKSKRYLTMRLFQKVFPTIAKEVFPVKSTVMELIDRTRSDFKPIEGPVLVIQAVDDKVVSSRGLNFLKRHSRNPRSKFIWLRDGGHQLVQGEKAREVSDICCDFIRDL